MISEPKYNQFQNFLMLVVEMDTMISGTNSTRMRMRINKMILNVLICRSSISYVDKIMLFCIYYTTYLFYIGFFKLEV